eukprot:PITA_04771
MKYISWNCRGLGSRLKEEALKDIVRIYSPEILLIQEMKLEDLLLLQCSKVFWQKGHGRAVSARGASGGIATFWNSVIYDLIQEKSSPHWLFTQLLHKDSGQQVSLFNVYAPVMPSKKKICWNALQYFLSDQNPENIIIAGDLNVTLALDEKKGGYNVRDPAREWVEDIMIGWDLEDIKPSLGKFTWSNKRLASNHIAARLDKFLVQSSFLTCGLMASSKILPNLASDHKPIILELSQDEKIRRLKRSLKEWAKSLKTPSAKRKDSLNSLAAHQLAMEHNHVTQSLLQKEVHKSSRDEEEFQRQKSRNLWLKSGDKNTSFFHKQAEARKHFKSVSEINFQNTVVKDFDGIKRAAYSFFKDLYSAPE